jgi:DNA polymerase elongation subunit (family B)
MSLVTFQALTWELQDKNPGILPSHFRGTEATERKFYRQCTQVIHVCGRTATGESVRIAVLDHRPVFYCRISEDRFRTAIINASTGFGSYKKTYDTWWVEGVEEVQKRIYQGFTNGREDRLLKITAANRNVMRAMVNELKDFETFDTRLDVISSFFHRTSIKPCGWINIKDCIAIDEEKPPFGYNISTCDHDYMCLTPHMEPLQSSEIAPFSVMSLDIEAFCPPNSDGSYPFPDGTVHNHKISTICLRYRCLGERANQDGTTSDGLEHVYFSYRKAHTETIGKICEEEGLCLNEAASYQADTEKEMLVRFLDYFRQRQPDIITGWNTLNFDMKYIFHRCTYYNLRLADVGKYEVWKTKLQKKNLSTAGAGNNEFQYFDITGVFQMDELVVVRRNMKMDSYSLNSVASEIIGDQKRDEPPSEIHRKSAGTDVELAEIIGYCIKDAALPDDIAKKLQDYVKSMMFANIAMVPIDYLLIRGANIKTYSLIADEVHRRNLVVSDKHRMFNQLDGKYAGATVLDALAGLYTDPVATLDFKSLYPSIIISQQLDPHTFVEDEQYLGLPGVEYKRFCWADEKTRKQYNFVIVTNGAVLGCSPLIPDVMERLWSERDSAKKRMKKATTSFEKSVHDGTQLAIKLMMNSIYGFLGAGDASPLPHLPLAMLTTKVGRDMIHETQRFVLAKYGTFSDRPDCTLEERLKMSKEELDEACGDSVVNVYGDSVADETAIMLRANGTIITTTFDELCSSDFIGPWQTALRPGEFATGKEFSTITARLEAWTDDGWTPVETIIRHRANKPMYRVTTHTGVVTVTADHSLLTAHGTSPSIEISPSSLRVSETILLTSWPQQTVESVGALTDENLPWLANTKTFARIIGMFVGDGSCGSYGSGIHTKHTWAINNSDLEMLERYKKICIQTFNHDFAIHICTCGVHKLVPTGGEYGSVRDFAFQFGKLCYDNHRRKKVPDFLHASSREIRAEFLGGFYDADGHKTQAALKTLTSVGVELYATECKAVGTGCKIIQKNEITSLGVYAIARSLGLNVSLNTRADKQKVFTQTWSTQSQRYSEGLVKKVEHISYECNRYVYDLTTVNHKFQAGVGQLVVHNTDSVFIKWSIPPEIRAQGDRSILEYAFNRSELAAEETTQHLNETMCPRKGIVELEFEKVYYYLILYSKKRYAGLLWTNLDKYDKIDCKGIQVVRRDNPLFVRKLLKKSLHSILVERNIDKCKQDICDWLESIVSGTVDLWDLTKSAKLKPDGYEGTPPAHAEVARRLRDRGLPVPDRVPYVFIVTDGKVLKDRAEDPSYVLEHPEIQIDYVYYLTNQIKTPLMDVLSPAVSGLDKLINTYVERMRKKQRPAEREIEQRNKRMRPMESFFKPLELKEISKHA